ncbi:MAG: hypothetical protein KDK04_09080 [Candidatus Competibacteraceae bacterium]|nr:hypothetical protein [Candidatus Competibacteraceae bacterium]MCB1803920.1 hypothetical protein [Candidatus Competibacteraceae bacterium]MCB1811854.1 hypothetical protein [Candidatus Competibacteraceae bacterium]
MSSTQPAAIQQAKNTQRAARWAALTQAWAATCGDPRQAAALLNDRMATGGPGPERGAQWTPDGVRQSAKRIRKKGGA